MFSKTNKGTGTVTESKSLVKSSPPSIISSDLKIVGDLSSDGEIQIDGAVDGDIRTKSLLVGETADIKGEIVADSVFVHGNINGQIKSRSVNLAKSAHVVGSAHTGLGAERSTRASAPVTFSFFVFLIHCHRAPDGGRPPDGPRDPG